MNHADQFPRLAAAMTKAGLDAAARRTLLAAAAADLSTPVQAYAQGDDGAATANPSFQAGWAKAFGTSEVAS